MPQHDFERPDCERAFAFTAGVCSRPGCGLHFVPLREDDDPICEVVISRDQVRVLLAYIHDKGLDL